MTTQTLTPAMIATLRFYADPHPTQHPRSLTASSAALWRRHLLAKHTDGHYAINVTGRNWLADHDALADEIPVRPVNRPAADPSADLDAAQAEYRAALADAEGTVTPTQLDGIRAVADRRPELREGPVNAGSRNAAWYRHVAEDIRVIAAAVELARPPADLARVAPKAGEARTLIGVRLHFYVGWEWLTGDGTWEVIRRAWRSDRTGNWYIATDTAPDWCQPTRDVQVRPVADPAERLTRPQSLPRECTCTLWFDSPFRPDADTVYARYLTAGCPAHAPGDGGQDDEPTSPRPSGHGHGHGPDVTGQPSTSVTVTGPTGPTVHRPLSPVTVTLRPGRTGTGMVVRSWDEGQGRWYTVSLDWDGSLRDVPARAVTAAPVNPDRWSVGRLVAYEVSTLTPAGSWEVIAADLTPMAPDDTPDQLAGRQAAFFAADTGRRALATVSSGDGRYGYAFGEPADGYARWPGMRSATGRVRRPQTGPGESVLAA